MTLSLPGAACKRCPPVPTRDGRVPIVGLDRELSRQALIRYRLRELAGVATYQALPGEDVDGGARERRLAVLPERQDEDKQMGLPL